MVAPAPAPACAHRGYMVHTRFEQAALAAHAPERLQHRRVEAIYLPVMLMLMRRAPRRRVAFVQYVGPRMATAAAAAIMLHAAVVCGLFHRSKQTCIKIITRSN